MVAVAGSLSPELTRVVSAHLAAQDVVVEADSPADAGGAVLAELEAALAAVPPAELDSFDRANVGLAVWELRRRLGREGGEGLDAVLEQARQAFAGEESAEPERRLLVRVLVEAAGRRCQDGDFTVARSWLDEAIAVALAGLGPEDLDTARAHNALGMWARYHGDFEVARQAYARARAVADTEPGGHLLGDVLHNLASLENLTGHPDHALELIEAAIARRPQGSLDRLADDGVRAVILTDLGRYHEADDLFASVTDRQQQRLSPDHSEVMQLNANWAVLEHRRGQLTAAGHRYASAITAAEAQHGINHPQVALICANAAQLAYDTGDFSTAASYAARAVDGLAGRTSDDLPSLRLARQVLDALAG